MEYGRLLYFNPVVSSSPFFFALSFFLAYSQPSQIGCKWNMLHTAGWKYTTQNISKIRHLGTIAQICRAVSSQLRHISTIWKKLLNSNISSTCSQNMVNFGPLAAEIGLPVRSTPPSFNGFRVLASLLHRCRSRDVNQTLHVVWPSPGLVHYVYIFGGSCHLTEFCQVQNSLCVLGSLAFSYIGRLTA